jgi:hypothetical protein
MACSLTLFASAFGKDRAMQTPVDKDRIGLPRLIFQLDRDVHGSVPASAEILAE